MNISLGELAGWVKDQVKHGRYQSDSEVVREAVRQMKEGRTSEPEKLQGLMDEAEQSGFKRFTSRDWKALRRLAKTGLAK
ncbi:MAG: type II toxin-antitoxin system ParD family antitoxin [Verrucomicrobia bacterium]|nr:MAG: type II toxin-antitoxin system ParD family antitoxin [Verrucomicrobiota bacterium]